MMSKDNTRRLQNAEGPSIRLSLPLVSLVLVIGIWTVSFFYKSPSLILSDTFRALAAHPHSPSLHIELAKELQAGNQITLMKKEIDLSANEKTPHLLSSAIEEKNVLGTQTSIIEMTEKSINSQKQILYWESVASDYPNFRDAYVQLATLSFNAGEQEKANHYIQKVLELDPNYSFPQALITN